MTKTDRTEIKKKIKQSLANILRETEDVRAIMSDNAVRKSGAGGKYLSLTHGSEYVLTSKDRNFIDAVCYDEKGDQYRILIERKN